MPLEVLRGITQRSVVYVSLELKKRKNKNYLKKTNKQTKRQKRLCPEGLETKQESEAYGAKGSKRPPKKKGPSAMSHALRSSRKIRTETFSLLYLL